MVFVGVNSPVLPALLFAGARAAVPVASLNYRLTADRLAELLDRLPDPLVVVDDAYRASVGPRHRSVRAGDWLSRALVAAPAEPRPVDDGSAAMREWA